MVDATSLLVIAATAGLAGLVSTAIAPRLVLPVVDFERIRGLRLRRGRAEEPVPAPAPAT